MPRLRSIRLRDSDQRWRTVPMPGAEQDLDLVPLEAQGNDFTMLGRFPAEFRRKAHGGYVAAEDVIVLDGRLELEGRTYERGTLLHIPARYPRTSMYTPEGCLVLAWFSGPALFQSPDKLKPVPREPVRSVYPSGMRSGGLLETRVSSWNVVPTGSRQLGGGDAVDPDLTMWARAGTEWPGRGPDLQIVRVAWP